MAPEYRSYTIKVKKPTIDFSKKCDAHFCMISNAVQEALGWAQYVMTTLQTIKWSDPDEGVRYTMVTPRKVVKALLDFDAGREVKPFVFILKADFEKPMGWQGDPATLQAIRLRHALAKKNGTAKKSKAKRPTHTRKFGMCVYKNELVPA